MSTAELSIVAIIGAAMFAIASPLVVVAAAIASMVWRDLRRAARSTQSADDEAA